MATTVVTITRTNDEHNDQVFIDAVNYDGEDVALVEALGILELGKALLVEQAGS